MSRVHEAAFIAVCWLLGWVIMSALLVLTVFGWCEREWWTGKRGKSNS